MKRGPRPGTKGMSQAPSQINRSAASPEWVRALAAACAGTTQAAVAKRLGYSPSVVNQVIRGSYKGDLTRVEAAVRGAFMSECVVCPVLGEIGRDVCLAHQRRGFDASSSVRAQLFHACRKPCRHYLGSKE
jgi:DNA-binding transcriptional regulator YdaS (Cro superfamily)